MINYWIDINKSEPLGIYWIADIYANSDLLRSYSSCETEEEAELAGKAFIDGVKFARGE